MYHPQIPEPPRPDGEAASTSPLFYDAYCRRSLLDHFLDAHATLDDVAANQPRPSVVSFLQGRYRGPRLRRTGEGVCHSLSA